MPAGRFLYTKNSLESGLSTALLRVDRLASGRVVPSSREGLNHFTMNIQNDITSLGGSDFQHRFVMANGLRFHILQGGSGPLVVLLAGFPQSCYAWRRVMPLLAQKYTVVAVDLPGQGDSDKPFDG